MTKLDTVKVVGQKTTKFGRQFLRLVLRESMAKNFGQFLLPTLTSINTSHVPKEIEFGLMVPTAMCRTGHTVTTKENRGVFATSMIMALFDELSSNGLMVKDQSYRGGVSIELSTEVFQQVHAGKDVLVKSRADKIGKMVSFSTIEMWDSESTQLLARGKHIKFMPMGLPFDIITSPVLLPLSLKVYSAFRGSKFSTTLDELLGHLLDHKKDHFVRQLPNNGMDYLKSEDIGAVFKLFNIEEIQDQSTLQRLLRDIPHPELGHCYQFKVRRNQTNGIGAMHGGAVASVIEESCSLARKALVEKANQSISVEKVEVRYFAPSTVSPKFCLCF
jgi:acyl-coenzyme A thioesterase PaaI-like protein